MFHKDTISSYHVIALWSSHTQSLKIIYVINVVGTQISKSEKETEVFKVPHQPSHPALLYVR